MPRQGKARSGLATIKDITQTLELKDDEGPLFKNLALNFLRKTKKLKPSDIIGMDDGAFYKLAREFLETETIPGEGPIHQQYWPFDDTFQRTLTYAANPSHIVRLVSHIMVNHKKNLLATRKRHVRQTNQSAQNREPGCFSGPSSTPDSVLETEVEPVEEEGEVSREASSESCELPSATEILRTAQQERAAFQSPNGPDPPNRLVTPPITPAVPARVERRLTFPRDSPNPSVEAPNRTTTVKSEASQRRGPPPPPSPSPPPIQRRDRGRKRSLSPFAEYNPRLPTHHDGTLDIARAKVWKDGVEFTKATLNKFNWGINQARQECLRAGDHDMALTLDQQTQALGDFLEYLKSEERKHEMRVKEFTASKMTLAGGSARARDDTNSFATATLSPGPW